MPNEYIALSDKDIELISTRISKLFIEEDADNFIVYVKDGINVVDPINPKSLNGRKFVGFSGVQNKYSIYDKDHLPLIVLKSTQAIFDWIKIGIKPKEVLISINQEDYLFRVLSYVMSGGQIIRNDLYNIERTYDYKVERIYCNEDQQ
ncbi:hypothetical protein [Mesotoga prima]|uniref:hypothetical protein n=1 Tax=Mesotoga prima TaxID=1184387 RepID=UPI002FD9E6CC